MVGWGQMQVDEETQIGLYNAERSIVDAFRLASHEGPELGNEALRRWLRAGGKPAVLLDAAARFPRTLTRLRVAMDVLL